MSETVLCPMGHEMELIQVAAGGYRYGCLRCATSFKARKTTSCGWLSPIKSTKERALEAATRRPIQKPLTFDEVMNSRHGCDPFGIKCLWVESNLTPLFEDCWVLINVNEKTFFFPKEPQLGWYEPNDGYNRHWRCWAQEPTDVERAAAAWGEAQ